MNIEDKLELMELANKFKVTKQTHDEGGFVYDDYIVEPKEPNDYPVIAKYSFERWKYFVSGVYNCGSNFAEINIEQLQALHELTKRLTGVD